jgi:hypothetical protein
MVSLDLGFCAAMVLQPRVFPSGGGGGGTLNIYSLRRKQNFLVCPLVGSARQLVDGQQNMLASYTIELYVLNLLK